MSTSPPSCPLCGSEMRFSRKRAGWACADVDCGHFMVEGSEPQRIATPFDAWPSVLARPLGELLGEVNPVVRLHRLCDSAEIVTRFFVAMFVADLAEVDPELHKRTLDGVLSQNAKRPTFGVWRELLDATSRVLPHHKSLAPDLLCFAREKLVPLLREGSGERMALVSLRNDVAHGSVVHHENARRLLGIHEEHFLRELASASEALSVLLIGEVRADHVRHAVGPAGRLHRWSIPEALAARFSAMEGKIIAFRSERILRLWPLLAETRSETQDEEHAAPTGIYARSDRDGLLYSMLWGTTPWSKSLEGLGAFEALFNLAADRRARNQARVDDFGEEMRSEGARLVGRKAELRRIKDAVAAAPSGILWVGGTAGIGKSTLAARTVADLLNGAHRSVVPYRFRAGDARCRARAFLKLAQREVSAWIGTSAGVQGSVDTESELSDDELVEAIREQMLTRGESAPQQAKRNVMLIFVLDGIDEVLRYDRDFVSLILRLQAPGVIWLLFGRPELSIEGQLLREGATAVFPGGLSRMCETDIRQMLLEGLGSRRYDLVRRDGALGDDNPFVREVVLRSEGLPLYVRHVVEDVVRGAVRVSDEDSLPAGLIAYYDELVRRLGLGDLDWMLPFLAVSVAWAESSMTANALQALLARRFPLAGDEGAQLVEQGIDRLGSMLRRIPAAGSNSLGFAPYHDTLRSHLRSSPALSVAGKLVRATYADAAAEVRLGATTGDLREYLLRFGTNHLIESGRYSEALGLVEWILEGDRLLDNDTIEAIARAFVVSLVNCPEDTLASLSKTALNAALVRANEHSYIRLLPALRSLLRGGRELDSVLDQLIENQIWACVFGAAIVWAPAFSEGGASVEMLLDLARDQRSHARELALYTLKNVAYAERDPQRRSSRLEAFLQERRHQRYSILSETLLNLALAGHSVSEFVQRHRLLDVRYPYLQVAYAAAVAAEHVRKNSAPDASWHPLVQVEYELAVTLEQQRLQWLDSSPGEPALVRAAIQSFHLLPNDLVALRDLGAALAEVKDLGVVARILLAHPAWEVRNSVAEAFGIAAKRRSDVPSICRELLESSDWRLRYGAVNVAYALRFQDRQLTIEVMQRGALDDHAWVSGLSADFLFDRFAGAPRALQERRIAEQTLHLDKLAQTRDMWVAYSLFHLAQTFNEEGWSDALPIARVGALLHDIPGWSTMDEDEFYAQLDRLM